MTRDHTHDWHAWTAHRCEAARARLIEGHERLIYTTRLRAVPCVPHRIDVEDLHQEGRIALVRAVDRFDPGRGVAFTSYAITQIRGAMLEYLRREDWAPRGVQDKRNAMRQALSLLWQQGRQPTTEALAALLNISEATLLEWFLLTVRREEIPLHTKMYHGDDDTDVGATLAEHLSSGDPHEDPAAVVAEGLETDAMRQMVGWLPDNERRVILRHYGDGVTLITVARETGRSGSRIRQLHTQALGRLRQYAKQEGLTCQ